MDPEFGIETDIYQNGLVENIAGKMVLVLR
jgi:hypothetical protein